MNRAFAILEIKEITEHTRTFEGIASTPTPDRVGDVVEPLGAQFKLPMPLLLDHSSRDQVGHVEFAKPNKSGIPFRAKITRIDEDGDAKRLTDKAWHFVKHGLRQFVSIGFRAIEDGIEVIENGFRFKKWEWLELSLVSIPAQPEAVITQLKSIDAALLAATGKTQRSVEQNPAGDSAKRSTTTVIKALEGRRAMAKQTFAEQISAFENTRAAKVAEMDALMNEVSDKGITLDSAQKETYDGLDIEVKEIDEHLVRLRASEKRNMEQARGVQGTTQRAASESRGSPVIAVRPALPKGVGYIRLFGARYLAKEHHVHPAEIARSKGWGDDIESVLKIPMDVIERAAVAAGTTTDATWAGPLVVAQNLTNEFIELLYAASVVNRIPGLTRVPFNIKVPRETLGAVAAWVGEGKPKPVSPMAFDSVSLAFHKLAGIVPITVELMKFSSPSAETLIRNSLVAAITKLVDTTFLDPAIAAVTGVSPASVTNGVSAIPSTGTTPEALRTDLYTLLATYATANQSTDGLVLVMRSSLALGIGMSRNAFGMQDFPGMSKEGGTLEGIPVVASQSVPTGLVIAINAPEILLADDGGVDFSVSTEASLQMDSAPDSPATATTIMVSLWQANMVGIRAERFITWVKARTGSVQYLSGVTIAPTLDEAAITQRLKDEEETTRRVQQEAQRAQLEAATRQPQPR